MTTLVFLRGLKLPACESLHSLPSTLEAKNTGSCAFTLHTSAWSGD